MSSENGVGSTTSMQVTVVESEACHFCEDARAALAGLATAYPLTVRTLDIRSVEGTQLMQAHRASMSPLVLVDGTFFSHGRLPRRKLLKLLTDRYGAADPARPPMASPSAGGRRG